MVFLGNSLCLTHLKLVLYYFKNIDNEVTSTYQKLWKVLQRIYPTNNDSFIKLIATEHLHVSVLCSVS